MSVTLTTIDNPFSPFDEFELWLQFDRMHCYNSAELLDRFVRVADCLSEADQELAYEEAVDHIVESPWLNPLGIYKKFKENSVESEEFYKKFREERDFIENQTPSTIL